MMRTIKRFAIGCLLGLICVNVAMAQTAEITYQGKLVENSQPANASYDFEFRLYDASTAGTLLDTRTRSAVAVTNGIFTVQLDFPPALFDGANRYLEIFVRPAGSGGGYQQLLPRQPLTSAPYAFRALTATNADNATNATNATNAANTAQLGGVAASQYVLTTDPRMTDARNPLPNSTNYVQNTTVQQAASDFNISGNGTAGGTLSANLVNAQTQYNIGPNRVLSIAGTSNTFVGRLAGTLTTGTRNAFFGNRAGSDNATGGNNSFFGTDAGAANTTGNANSFFGSGAGQSNTTSGGNSFFGNLAGAFNTTGDGNAFFGSNSGFSNTTGSSNSYFGSLAGTANTTGNRNAFFGKSAGDSNVTGNDNAFFGYRAGTFSTANNNSFFGSDAGNQNTTGFNNSFFGRNAGQSNTSGNGNSFFGNGAGSNNVDSSANSFFGNLAGSANTSGGSNTFIGNTAGNTNTTGSNNTIIGAGADVSAGFLSFATAIGAGATAFASNSITLGRSGGSDSVFIPGRVTISTLGLAGSTQLCRNSFNDIAACSSSLRYKTDFQPFIGGLDIVHRLCPISFNWKGGGLRDVGFAAEDVEKIEPLLVTSNSKGEIEGVKYGQITAVLVNAIKEQQTLIEVEQERTTKLQEQVQRHNGKIEQQRRQMQQQQQAIDALRKIVCQQNPQAEICKE